MTALARIPAPHLLVGALCLGLGGSLVVRSGSTLLAAGAVALVALALVAGPSRAAWLGGAFLLLGLWWGGLRLDDLDRSQLAGEIGSTAIAHAEVTGPARTSPFAIRVPVRVRRWDGRVVDEAARLQLPLGRAPPQGALLEVIASANEPRAADEGERFDEQRYLRRQGVHVVLRADSFRIVGRRGGLGGVADRLRGEVGRTMAPGLDGERRAVVAGIVLGEDEGLEEGLRDSFRASGLYHLLSAFQVSFGQVVVPSGGTSDGQPRREFPTVEGTLEGEFPGTWTRPGKGATPIVAAGKGRACGIRRKNTSAVSSDRQMRTGRYTVTEDAEASTRKRASPVLSGLSNPGSSADLKLKRARPRRDRETLRRGWRLDKPDRASKIDAVVALAMAVEGQAYQPEPVEVSGGGALTKGTRCAARPAKPS